MIGKLALLTVAVAVGFALIGDDNFRILPKADVPGVMNLMHGLGGDTEQEVSDYLDKFDGNQGGRTPEMVNHYYNIATDFYEYGWGKSFHFAHEREDESHDRAIERHEERLAGVLDLKPGQKVLDAGCGVGGPARTIAKFSKAHVTGVTINDYQIQRGKVHTEKAGLTDLVDLQQGDFTKLQFEEGTFDAAYAIEATCHAQDLRDVYGEIFRTLKSGGTFATYEWITTPEYDANNEEHKAILHEIEIGNGLPPVRDLKEVLAAAKDVGFEFVSEVDLAQDRNGTRPWYNRMDMSWLQYQVTDIMCGVMELLHLAPKGTRSIHGVLLRAADGLLRGGKANIFTPMHLVVFKKP